MLNFLFLPLPYYRDQLWFSCINARQVRKEKLKSDIDGVIEGEVRVFFNISRGRAGVMVANLMYCKNV